MNQIPEWMWDVWRSGDFSGLNYPNCRAVIATNRLTGSPYYRSLIHHQKPLTVEIPNISKIDIDKRTDSAAASMTMTLKNFTRPTAGENLDVAHDGSAYPTKRQLRDLGKPGFLAYRRGVATDADGVNPWSHDTTVWTNLLVPNRVIHTFQGYGSDGAAYPWNDTRLKRTGVWLIDKVTYEASGDVTIECRDMAKLLIEQRLYPPIIPVKDYPLEICADGTVIKPVQGPNLAQPVVNAGLQSSAQFWVGFDGSVCGHTYADAFDGDLTTLWLSAGNDTGDTQVDPGSYEWIQAKVLNGVGTSPIKRIRYYQLGMGRLVWVSVYGRPLGAPDGPGNNGWMGEETIPYQVEGSGDRDNHADIPYLLKLHPTHGDRWVTIDLPDRVEASAVRLTFSSMSYTVGQRFCGPSDPYPYKAAVAAFEIYDTPPTEVPVEGNIDDYTDIVKLFCAWAGFTWDPNAWPFSGAAPYDPLLEAWSGGQQTGRVWGDFFYSGAYPVDPYCIEPSFWDNKSVMDGINQIREILGFTFFIDSSGGVQWRPPNIWRTGNYILGQGYVGDHSVRTVSEDNVLIDYGTTIDDSVLRSAIIAVSADDPSLHAVGQPGFAPGETSGVDTLRDIDLLAGQVRTMLISEYPFGQADDPYARAQIEKFVYLISLWTHWAYRTSSTRIPGTPGLDIDDQVRIYERTTSEVYVHYIKGLRSSMDLDQGTWYMDLDTHWMGNGPDALWVTNISEMHPALFAYLKSIGQISDDVPTSIYPPGWEEFELPPPPPPPPRLDTGLEELFPDPPELNWPAVDWASEQDHNPYIVEPSTGGAGSAFNCSNGAKFSYWGSPGQTGLFTVVYFGGIGCSVDRRAATAFRALNGVLADVGWNVSQASTYSYRRIKRTNGSYGSSWSNHAWALAVDLDPNVLPQGKRAPAGHPVWAAAQKAVNLRTAATGKPIFRWGGTWSGSTVDPMHFEVCCTPEDLAQGVAGAYGPT